MRALIRPAVVLFVLLTFLAGVAYPIAVTGIALTLFPRQATGSLVDVGGGKRASLLIGQSFSDPRYFWPRPSAAGTFAYNPLGSAGSNLAPGNPALVDAVRERVHRLKAADPSAPDAVPVDLVTTSASGIDPHESTAAAAYQVARVAHARGMNEGDVRQFIMANTEPRTFGMLGEERVNVLLLNAALDRSKTVGTTHAQVLTRALGFVPDGR